MKAIVLATIMFLIPMSWVVVYSITDIPEPEPVLHPADQQLLEMRNAIREQWED